MQWRSVAVVLVLWLAPLPAIADERADGARVGLPTFRSGVELVPLSVTVTDRQGRFVGDLTRENFEIFEDGVPQDISFFEGGHVPIDLAVLIDTSASMAHRMRVVRAGALSFIRTLGPQDRASVVGFSHIVRTLQPWTSDQHALTAAVEAADGRGGTSLYTAIYVALRSFEPPPPGDVRRQAIVVLSDGDDTSSLISFEDMHEVAQRSGVSIYTIMVRTASDQGRSSRSRSQGPGADFVMRTLSRETGARAFTIARFEELEGVYQVIAEEIANQYVLGYVPKPTGLDRPFRHIQVRVVSRPDVTWRTRTGYLIQSEPAGRVASAP
jgi:Ca-activated chloride channel homolog